MFKSENIVDTNGTTHCKLKQDIKIVFNSNTLIELTKASCTFMKNNKKSHLLNSRRKYCLNFFLFVFYIILIMQYVE
jgi:hypothetical protein